MGYVGGVAATVKVGKNILGIARLASPYGWASILLFEVFAPYLFPSMGKSLGREFIEDLWEGIQEWEFDEARIK